MSKLIGFFVLLLGSMLIIHTVLQNGSFLKYLDEHPDPRWVPATEYYVGHGYYLMQDLTSASTYFVRVEERYPTSAYADDAYFRYVNCLEDGGLISRPEIVAGYQKYLERFPTGVHIQLVQNRLDAYKNGTR